MQGADTRLLNVALALYVVLELVVIFYVIVLVTRTILVRSSDDRKTARSKWRHIHE
jgi:hypothetical protein